MIQPNYGDLRLFVCREDGTENSFVATDTVERLGALAALSQAARGEPPWTHVCLSVWRGFWVQQNSVQVIPKPGWACPGAVYCRVCGDVAHDGAPLGCSHGSPSAPHPKVFK